MAQELKDLLEKINKEGIEAAENNARKIEQDAKDTASAVIDKAKKEAQNLLEQARQEIKLMEEKQRSLLSQAGRDLLLSLRSAITDMLARIIREKIHEVLSPQELGALISHLVKAAGESGHKAAVTMKKEDIQALERHFISALRDEIKNGLVLKPSQDVVGGFYISFDAGKTQFDFTDKALAEYIGIYLKPKLAQILGLEAQK